MNSRKANHSAMLQKLKNESQIKGSEAAVKIRGILKNIPRQRLMFDLATQTGIQLKDLLDLKAKNLTGKKPGEPLFKNEPKLDYPHNTHVTPVLRDSLKDYFDSETPGPQDYVFKSRKGGKPLRITSALALVKEWFEKADVDLPSGAKALRKIWQATQPKALDKEGAQEKKRLPFKRIRPLPLQEVVFMELFSAIANGDLKPGDRIEAENVAKEMNVSRSTVYEALRRISDMGYVNMRYKKGCVVRESPQAHYGEVQEALNYFSVELVKKAAKNRSNASISRLEKLREFLRSENITIEQRAALTREYLFTLYKEADMPIFFMVVKWLYPGNETMAKVFEKTITEKNPKYSIWYRDQFRYYADALLDAIKQRDSQKAGELMTKTYELSDELTLAYEQATGNRVYEKASVKEEVKKTLP